MAATKLGRTLVIANPAAQSGRGAEGAEFVRRFLESYEAATSGFELKLTEKPGDATTMARESVGCHTVVALGGDGIIHEVVNGLMGIDELRRPQLGIIPFGSGNDFARTLNVARNAPEASLGQLIQGEQRTIELGWANGTYFMETLSWGLDAAIALDTMERRKSHSGEQGTRLFANSGLHILSKHRNGWRFKVTFDGSEVVEDVDLTFAVQVGPTYGGGFRVCPKAVPTDGKLDVCFSRGLPSVPHTLMLFGAARFGQHAHSGVMNFRQVERLSIDFETEPPCQADGEPLTGTHYDVHVVPNALKVVVPHSCPW